MSGTTDADYRNSSNRSFCSYEHFEVLICRTLASIGSYENSTIDLFNNISCAFRNNIFKNLINIHKLSLYPNLNPHSYTYVTGFVKTRLNAASKVF